MEGTNTADKAKGKKKDIYLEVINSNNIEGQLIKKRFMVSHPLDKGSFGTIYECIDLNNPNDVYVIKISENY
jgi:hypothetical protein